jgi:cephalosporin-C deacetylase-like acetyl esterase
MKNNTMFLGVLILLFSMLNLGFLIAQPAEKFVKVVVSPDRADWNYSVGEKPKFTVTVLKNSVAVKNPVIRYEVGPEMMPPVKKDSLQVKGETFVVDGGTLQTPGFIRCKVVAWVDGGRYESLATAAFNPETIKPTTNEPADFSSFWLKAMAENAKIPMDVKLTLLPERCTEKVNVYHASIQNFKIGTRVYGILCVPKKAGKYPALLKVPGAGVRPYAGDVSMAENGIIVFEIGIHGIPVTMEGSIYSDLGRAVLDGYPFYNLDDKDRYYYKRVYLGCVRAVDFIYSLPEFDGKTLAVSGGSQGGALSIITAGLDARIKYLAAFYPALSDLTGYLHSRAGGWPHMFMNKQTAGISKEKIETSKYYDVVNFARHVNVPGFYSWGYNDVVCPPTSMYSAYNVIMGPKTLFVAQETGHWTYPEQNEKSRQWLLKNLTGK